MIYAIIRLEKWREGVFMLKRKADIIIREWINHGHEALLISGARQTGKTYSIRSNLQKTNADFVELNFIEQPELIPLFEQATTAKDLLLRLSVVCKKALVKGKTIFFFDEVQEFKDIMTRIKFLVDEGSYRYILSGSLLGVELHNLRSAPVGYVSIIDMYPMDFEEFAIALGVQDTTIHMLKDCYIQKLPVDEFVHKKMLDVFYLYLIVGGMPEAIVQYLETNNIQKVSEVQSKIISLYQMDFSKYEVAYSLYLKEIYQAMASELNQQNKRFTLNKVKKGVSYDRMKNNFLWLKDAGVALPVYNLDQPKHPLKLNEQRNLFKLFYSDVGLLTSQYPDNVKMKLLNKDKGINNGALFENVVAQELFAHHIDLYYYNSKKYGELDFVIELNGEIYPLEIKSGKDYKRHSALQNVLNEPNFDIHQAVVLSNANVEQKANRLYYPIYMIMFFQNEKIHEPIYKLDITGL